MSQPGTPFDPRQAAGASRLTLLDGLICVYLVLPLLAFATWFKWPVAIVLAFLLISGASRALAPTRWRHVELDRRKLIAILLVSLAWTAVAGIGHFFYANSDWTTRDAVLRDLVKTPWPPMYDTGGGDSLILRAPVGYYLPVAAAGSVLGLRAADLLLYLWTAGGFALVLWAVATLFPTRREQGIACALMLGFGGLDIVGFRVQAGELPRLGQHIERWAEFAQYSSNSTLMFWVPNHALPAWLGMLIALRHWRTAELARLSSMLFAAIMLWSPLSVLGLVPFYLLGLNWRRDATTLLATRSGLPFVAIAGLVARYLTMDTQSIPRSWAMAQFYNAETFWLYYAGFCLLEFGILAVLLLRLRAFDVRVTLGVAILLILPFFHFGTGNDLVMRCSIPALMVLALASVRPLAARSSPVARTLLALVLLAGSVGAMQEPLRSLIIPRWAPSGQTLAQISTDGLPGQFPFLPPNYVGHLNQPGLQALLRPPSMVVPSPDTSPRIKP